MTVSSSVQGLWVEIELQCPVKASQVEPTYGAFGESNGRISDARGQGEVTVDQASERIESVETNTSEKPRVR